MGFLPKLFGPARSTGAKTPWTAHQAADAVPAGAGEPVGTARLDLRGTGKAVLTLSINVGAAQTSEIDLPWMIDYPLYPGRETRATVDSAGRAITGSVTMNGMILAVVEDQPDPVLSYTHRG